VGSLLVLAIPICRGPWGSVAFVVIAWQTSTRWPAAASTQRTVPLVPLTARVSITSPPSKVPHMCVLRARCACIHASQSDKKLRVLISYDLVTPLALQAIEGGTSGSGKGNTPATPTSPSRTSADCPTKRFRGTGQGLRARMARSI
jgi:hypothetical protein